MSSSSTPWRRVAACPTASGTASAALLAPEREGARRAVAHTARGRQVEEVRPEDAEIVYQNILKSVLAEIQGWDADDEDAALADETGKLLEQSIYKLGKLCVVRCAGPRPPMGICWTYFRADVVPRAICDDQRSRKKKNTRYRSDWQSARAALGPRFTRRLLRM